MRFFATLGFVGLLASCSIDPETRWAQQAELLAAGYEIATRTLPLLSEEQAQGVELALESAHGALGDAWVELPEDSSAFRTSMRQVAAALRAARAILKESSDE
jgi:hypothetical protein